MTIPFLVAKYIVVASQLYCWTPSNYSDGSGAKSSPTCALSYEQCQKLVSSNGGGCRSQ